MIPYLNGDFEHHFYLAGIAILQENWDEYARRLEKITKPVFRFALEAEAAFKKRQYDKAEQFGEIAVSSSRGLQRYILHKSRERRQKETNRKSYF